MFASFSLKHAAVLIGDALFIMELELENDLGFVAFLSAVGEMGGVMDW